MKTEEIIEQIEDLLKNSRSLPLMGGKVGVDQNQLLELLGELSATLPSELKQAKKIVAERSEILEEAHREADKKIRQAEERRKNMINESEVMRNAKASADQVLADAKLKSKEVRRAANDYVDEIMKRADEMLTANVNELRKTRQSIKASQRQGSN